MQNVQTCINGFISHCQYEKNLSQKTLKAYRIDLRQFSDFLKSEHSIININVVDIHRLIPSYPSIVI